MVAATSLLTGDLRCVCCGGCVEWTVSLRVDSEAVEFALDMGVPVVLDLVIGSTR